MSKKFFTLIHGEKVHIAPETKVISADALGKLKEAEEVLEAVKKDAERYRTRVASECEALKDQAEQEGFARGFSQWAEQLAWLEKEIQKTREELEKVIVPVAIKAAKKIVAKELESSEKTILSIVSTSLKSVAGHKRVNIFVNREDLPGLEKNKGELKKIFEQVESFAIHERDDINSGGCVIETEGGIINAQLGNKWDVLEQAFLQMMSHESNQITSET